MFLIPTGIKDTGVKRMHGKESNDVEVKTNTTTGSRARGDRGRNTSEGRYVAVMGGTRKREAECLRPVWPLPSCVPGGHLVFMGL